MWSLDPETMKITMTKSDTPSFQVTCNKVGEDGTLETYVPEEGDVFTFAAKKGKTDTGYLFAIDIPTDTMIVSFSTEDTADLDLGKYFYDIQLQKPSGFRDTFIHGILMIQMEVYDK